MTAYYNNKPTKFFKINGQQYSSKYVNKIQYLNSFNYGYANVIMNSGSSINLPSEEAFINFLFEQDWLTPTEIL